ncbi:ATP-binding protein [Desmonostoc muscorum LEGE 12446]|uniref:Circadian input-output histidine kinase CikA n=1 Tax=Desmonostoc muscorum LEGE 12446 TaxID=1828758 RepID=A0A8J6ZVX7_DESMC|nr:ATP-binding protein [Desmonostoc muscorum]MCF2149248.1 ATP-binding protein [Desmonostoc muscorum LEGE 12446]
MHDFVVNLFSSGSFIPHGHCYLWKPGLVWLHLISDAIIALAYYSIPLTLFYFVRKRQDLPFYWIFLLFATFIISCGTTHIAEIWTLWYPTYWLSGILKAGTAIISLFTAIELVPLVPQALALPSPAQLTQANKALHAQIEERLRVENQLRGLQDELEQRVQTRTAELVKVNQQLQQEIDERHRAEAEREQLLAREQVAREQAEAANRIKDEFLAVLSHELRSPLNPILGWAKLLQSGTLDEQKTKHALATIERNANLQTQLIGDLLDISRILQGKLNLNIGEVDLATTIQSAMETVCLAAQAKSIQIQTVLNEAIGKVAGDSGRLQQIIWNLLTNAIKFTPEGGQVEVRLEQVGSDAQIVVRDTGKGISADFLPYVFDHFRQEEGATTRKFGGLGLGLAIVRHLTELHGGWVTAQSPGIGQGATFIVRIPLMKVARLDIESSPNSLTHGLATSPLAGLCILVVDDDADTCDYLSFVLEQAGATVILAASADEALQVLVQSTPDILLSDIGMPDMDGYMLIRQVRSLPLEQGGQIPAIALTAYAGEINQQQAIAAGFQKHLSKPVEPEYLLRTITSLGAVFVGAVKQP